MFKPLWHSMNYTVWLIRILRMAYFNPHITRKLGSIIPCQIGKTTWKLQYMPIIHKPYSLKSCLDIGILAVLDWTNGMAWNFGGCNSSWQKVEAKFGSFSDSCWDLKVSFYKNLSAPASWNLRKLHNGKIYQGTCLSWVKRKNTHSLSRLDKGVVLIHAKQFCIGKVEYFSVKVHCTTPIWENNRSFN